MSGMEFNTTGFRDSEAVIVQTMNRIEGQALLLAFRAHAKAMGVTCGEVFHEDYGWAMEARLGDASYLCNASVEDAVEHAADQEHRPPDGTRMFAMLWVTQDRSLLDRLLGRNRPVPDDPIGAMIRSFLAGAEGCTNLKVF